MSLFVEDHVLIFLFLTLILGGGAAYLAGRGMAIKWRPVWMPLLAMVPLTLGLRFLHYALFQANLVSLHYFITDFIILLVFAFVGYRVTMVKKMTRQYPWLYEKASPFGWRSKA